MKRLSIILKATIVACIVVGFAACGSAGSRAAKDYCNCLKKGTEDCEEMMDKKYSSYKTDPKFLKDFAKGAFDCPEVTNQIGF